MYDISLGPIYFKHYILHMYSSHMSDIHYTIKLTRIFLLHISVLLNIEVRLLLQSQHKTHTLWALYKSTLLFKVVYMYLNEIQKHNAKCNFPKSVLYIWKYVFLELQLWATACQAATLFSELWHREWQESNVMNEALMSDTYLDTCLLCPFETVSTICIC